MKLSELFAFLQEHSLVPLKQLSQNFLIDSNILQKICRAAEVNAEDLILEIGPGPGALTQALLEKGAQVIAIEKDRGFAEQLPRLQTVDHRLTVLSADALEIPFPIPQKSMKVVANLPYHITTPLLARFCEHATHLSSATVMIQKEVAQRLVAQESSSISLFLQFYAKISCLFSVSKDCFYPRPSVDSAVIRLDFHPVPPLQGDASSFFRLIHKAFQQKRKMIQSSLKELYPSAIVQQALLAISLRPDARPSTLSLQEWIALFQKLQETLIISR